MFKHLIKTSSMKTKIIALLSLVIGGSSLHAQNPAFNNGSNGSYGPMNITANTTLQLPADGIFHCTTVSIAATLKFSKNPNNTPVYILATGDIVLSGLIDVSGKNPSGPVGGFGGVGGFDGGAGQIGGIQSGSGFGPGGGRGMTASGTTQGPGAYRIRGGFTAAQGAVYGNSLIIPLVGGSGGGGCTNSGSPSGGGGGGGAILLSSNTRVLFQNGTILANCGGGVSSYSSGSGGAIRIVSPLVGGNVTVSATGAGGIDSGSGRIRIDAFDISTLTFAGNPRPDAYGTVMVVFPSPIPKLSVSNAAGTAVAENAAGPVSVILPAGTNPNQTIQVRARDFGGVVPIRVRLVPESGDATTYDAFVDNTVDNPATANVPVTLPINTGVQVEVFTR